MTGDDPSIVRKVARMRMRKNIRSSLRTQQQQHAVRLSDASIGQQY
jgi:hypothetical protein